MPSLVKLYREFENSGFVVLAIAIRDDNAAVKKYAREQRLPFPVLLDTGGEVAFAYGAQATPVHYLIDRKGHAAAVVQGARDWTSSELRNIVKYLLDKK